MGERDLRKPRGGLPLDTLPHLGPDQEGELSLEEKCLRVLIRTQSKGGAGAVCETSSYDRRGSGWD